MMITTDLIWTVDPEKQAIRRSIYAIYREIRDFVPDACHDRMMERLYEFFEKNDLELTSGQMRKEAEAIKRVMSDNDAALKANMIKIKEPE